MTKTIAELNQSLESQYSAELLERSVNSKRKQLHDMLENQLHGNIKVLIDEKIAKMEQKLDSAISVSLVQLAGGAAFVYEASEIHKSGKVLDMRLKEIKSASENVLLLLETREVVAKELTALNTQIAHRLYASFEASVWKEYYQDLSCLQSDQDLDYDDDLVDDDDLGSLRVEEEVQELLNDTHSSIIQVEHKKLILKLCTVDSVFEEMVTACIKKLDAELDITFKQIDIVSNLSADSRKRNKESMKTLLHVEQLNTSLSDLSNDLQEGLTIMERFALSDRSKIFIDTSDPQVSQLCAIFKSSDSLSSTTLEESLVHRDRFLFAAKEWVVKIKQETVHENEMIEKYSETVHELKTLIHTMQKSVCRFSSNCKEYKEKPDDILKMEDTISAKVFGEFYPAISELQY